MNPTDMRNSDQRAQLAQYLFLAPWCQSQTVLVAECHTGEGVLTLAQHGAQWVDALDGDASHIRLARQHHAHPSVAYHPKSAADAQMNRTYQRVLCLNLLEHTENPDRLVRNLHQHLAEDGVMALSVAQTHGQSLDFQALRNVLVPYFPYLYLFYINQHLAVSIADKAEAEPAPRWLTPHRQLDVNACDGILVLAGRQRFSTSQLPAVIAIDDQDYLADIQQQAEQLTQTVAAMQQQQLPLQQQLAAAQQDYLTLKSDLVQSRDQALTAAQRLIEQQRLVRRYKRFENSRFMQLSQHSRGVWLRLRREWRHGGPIRLEKPQLPQSITLPWQKKRGDQPRLVQTLSWKNAPIEQLLMPELDWVKQQALKKHRVAAGFNKVLVVGDSTRWATWHEAFELHGLTFGRLPLSALLSSEPTHDEPTGLTGDTLEDTLKPWLDADVVIMHQVPFSDSVQKLMVMFKNRYTPLVFDTDELSTDADALLTDDGLSGLPRLERERRMNLAERLRLTRDFADYALAPDQALALALKTEDSPCYVAPTPISYAQRVLMDVFKNPERYWEPARRLWVQLPPDATAGDSQPVVTVLVKLLLRYPNLKITVNGAWTCPTDLTLFAQRITQTDGLPLLEQMRQLASHDIQLLPINPHYPLRQYAALAPWVRLAALAGVPTVSSPAASLMSVLQDGVTGYMATSPEEWQTHLIHLIEQPNVRETMAQQARDHAIKTAYVDNQLPALVSTLEQLMAHYQRHKHPDTGLTAPGAQRGINVAVALTWQSPLPLDTLCRLRAFLGMGLYITVYLHTSQAMVDLRSELEAMLGPANGRYHCARLKDVLHIHDVCLALDWQALEAAQSVQSRFGLCLRWMDHLDTDGVPMGLERLRMEQTYRYSQWLHMTPSVWLADTLTQQYQAQVQCLAPWVMPVSNKAPLNTQRVLVVMSATMQDWLVVHLAAIKRQCPDWTFHIMSDQSPKNLPFDHTHYPLPQSLDAMSGWLISGDMLLLASCGAPPPLVYWAMAHGLPVADVAIPGREDRYDSQCPVVQLPLGAYADQVINLLTSHHYRLQLAEQGVVYTEENTITLDSQTSRIVTLAKQQQQRVSL